MKKKFLREISGGEEIIIPATDGTKGIIGARDVFYFIDPDFEGWGADQKGLATVDTSVSVSEMARDATFHQIFGNLKKKSFTGQQVVEFVKLHRDWLRTEGYATFFPLNKFFVASVRFRSDGKLIVRVVRFEDSSIWRTESRHRVVVPRLA